MLERERALALLREHCPEENTVRHSLASEAVMRALARRLEQDEEAWGMTGLLHDLDYAMTKHDPQQHGPKTVELLKDALEPEPLAAIAAHNSEYTGVEPTSLLDFALRAGETVTGLITAAALVRPTGIEGMRASSLKKKMKDKAFAAGVSRERSRECEKIGLPLDQFLPLAIEAMTPLCAK